MREKGQTEAAKTLETPVFSRGIEILTEKLQLYSKNTGIKVELLRDRIHLSLEDIFELPLTSTRP